LISKLKGSKNYSKIPSDTEVADAIRTGFGDEFGKNK